jgi:transcriptional regulator with XRE-family HTH domain
MKPVDDFEKVLGRVIAEARRSVGLSQEALAFRCKLHPTYISQLERGLKSPTVRVLRAIAAALSTTASSLLLSVESAFESSPKNIL